MLAFPPAKINLGLSIVGKRPDGYHDLVTCFYPIRWLDVLEVIPSDKFSFTSSGVDIPGKGYDNLCVKAYQLLEKEFDLPAIQLHIHKIIPMGAGLGGGSSDAAWTLRLLQQIFALPVSAENLSDYAARLGSDCPFFITDKPMLGTGRGELLQELGLQLKGKYLVVVKPDLHISTAEAFAGVRPQPAAFDLKEVLEKYPVEKWKDFLTNDFETTVFRKYPQVAEIKTLLYDEGALFASMTGSGSSVYGIFDRAKDLQGKFTGMQCWQGWAQI